MPPAPSSATISYGPRRRPGSRAGSESSALDATLPEAGPSMKSPAARCAATSDTTSERSAVSAPQAWARNSSRSASGRSRADWNSSFRRCQRSGVMRRRSRRAARSAWPSRAARRGRLRTLRDAAEQPGPGQTPLTRDGGFGYAQRLRGVLDAETAEEAQLHELRLFGIEQRQLLERL